MDVIKSAPDCLDIDQMDDTLRSNWWAAYQRKLDEILQRELKVCESIEATAEQVRFGQGAVKMLRLVRELPEIIRQELRKPKGKT